jgi:hypothetical protein
MASLSRSTIAYHRCNHLRVILYALLAALLDVNPDTQDQVATGLRVLATSRSNYT